MDKAEFDRVKADPNLTDEDGKDALYRHMAANEAPPLGGQGVAHLWKQEHETAQQWVTWASELRAKIVETRARMDAALEKAEGYVEIVAAAAAMAALDEVLVMIDGGSDD